MSFTDPFLEPNQPSLEALVNSLGLGWADFCRRRQALHAKLDPHTGRVTISKVPLWAECFNLSDFVHFVNDWPLYQNCWVILTMHYSDGLASLAFESIIREKENQVKKAQWSRTEKVVGIVIYDHIGKERLKQFINPSPGSTQTIGLKALYQDEERHKVLPPLYNAVPDNLPGSSLKTFVRKSLNNPFKLNKIIGNYFN
mgnify:CR=1 FL=1